MKKLTTVVCLSVPVLLAATQLSAEAGVRNIWADQFEVSVLDNESSSLLDSYSAARAMKYMLSAKEGMQTAYEAEVKLPVGARITRVEISAESNPGGEVVATLSRTRLDGTFQPVSSVITLSGPTEDKSWHATESILQPRIDAGYRYWLYVAVKGIAYVYGARVSYR